jgi:hypothetical protein
MIYKTMTLNFKIHLHFFHIYFIYLLKFFLLNGLKKVFFLNEKFQYHINQYSEKTIDPTKRI